MKLAVSNIAWPPSLEEGALSVLRNRGTAGIEVAPTRWWPDWKGASPAAGRALRQQYSVGGFTIPALQAILFGRPEDRLFGSDNQREGLMSHLRLCADLASAMGARSLVFGAPKNRQLNGMPPGKAFDLARELFASVGPYYERRNVCLCLEANPPQYGCEFLTTSTEAATLVKAVKSPGVGLHLDTACMYLAQEDIAEAVRNSFEVLCHFHVSEPGLSSFDAPVIDHAAAAKALRSLRYSNWVSLEMRETQQPLSALTKAADFLARTYGPES